MTPERWQQVKEVLATALEMPSAERAAYLDRNCAGDALLRHELDALLLDEEKLSPEFLGDSALAEAAATILPQPANPWIGRRVGAYRVVEQIGAGGMGEVYRAVRADDQYQKETALKLVRTGFNSGFVIARFRNERQILATLDHPNIARLLDGGTTEEEIPYFVMELIEGQPITEYCEGHRLSIPERLALFLQACSAVQYAHQHLIIHRDIKPSNILVTAEGAPKLLDFGIAKILDVETATDLDRTETVFRVLTPAYASPEQIKGEPITTASDVYSLGVVLYELLTGCHPYRGDEITSQELARAVCEVDPEKPSAAVRRTKAQRDGSPSPAPPEVGSAGIAIPNKRLQGDLDNIVLMALRKEPERRYSSVEQFAEDIRRHLQSLPVIARRDTLGYRTAKFIARHRVKVTAGIAIVLTLVAGLAITLREASIARIQRRKAEQRFQDVRALANSLIFDVHDSIADLPGATPARKLIVEKALQYLDGLARESQDDPGLQRELAEAYKRIGDVQGYEFSANLGDNQAALKSYEKALAIRKALWSSDSSEADSLQLAQSYRLVSVTQLFSNNLSDALNNIQQAVVLMESSVELHPPQGDALRELITDYQSAANILAPGSMSSLGDSLAASGYRRKQLEAAQRFANLDPTDEGGQGTLAVAIAEMGDQLWQSGERLSPLQYYSKARPILTGLSEHSHRQARALYLLEQVCVRIATVELSNGDTAQSLRVAREASEIASKLSLSDPADAQASEALADTYVLLTDLESRRGDAASATLHLNKAMSLMEQVMRKNPTDTENLGSQAELYVVAGDLASRSGDNQKALQLYEEAIALLSRVQSENPRNVGARERLAATYNKVGRAQMKLRSFDAAVATLDRARVLADPATAAARQNAQALYTIADSYSLLGEIEAGSGSDATLDKKTRLQHWQSAVSCYQQSLATWAGVKEPGLVSPDLFDALPPALVTRQLTRANAALARLTSAKSSGSATAHP